MHTNTLQLSKIYIYPIKSLGRIALQTAKVTERGLEYDRRWMIVDAKSGVALTQRTVSEMALLQVALTEQGLLVTHAHQTMDELLIPFQSANPIEMLEVNVWGSICLAQAVDKEIDKWFSEAIGRACRLVYMADDCRRLVDTEKAKNGEIVSFADGYPLLLIGQAALDDLNARMDKRLPMNRFRPNLVFSGGVPYEDDYWGSFRIGTAILENVKPCSRCILTTLNQTTLKYGKEPLKTLATYRKVNNKILFGQNLLVSNAASAAENWVSVGAEIEVLSRK